MTEQLRNRSTVIFLGGKVTLNTSLNVYSECSHVTVVKSQTVCSAMFGFAQWQWCVHGSNCCFYLFICKNLFPLFVNGLVSRANYICIQNYWHAQQQQVNCNLTALVLWEIQNDVILELRCSRTLSAIFFYDSYFIVFFCISRHQYDLKLIW